MIYNYGMGRKIIYSFRSEKYKTIIDEEIQHIINECYTKAKKCLIKYKQQIVYGAYLLKQTKTLNYIDLLNIINLKNIEINNYTI
jgi:ATP-dependent Zn protease